MLTFDFFFKANIKLSASQVEPGQNISIKVSAKCNSYVGLLRIDKSVVLLGGNGNDLSKAAVFEELSQYSTTKGSYPTITRRPYSISYYPTYQRLVVSIFTILELFAVSFILL